ncbi:MAG TPA: hypothetical protein VG797_00030, partial [Phycisphaerales bacterium]|nr:hypothetical protein [Phycisphaerales bacterium]
RSYKPDQPGELFIGDKNVIREGVTLHRGNWNGPATRVGSNCYIMAQAHAGHNAQIGDWVTMANAAALAGHSSVGNYCVLSAFASVHQFTSVGEGVMFQACGRVSMHVPPWCLVADYNTIAGLNRIGMRRNPNLTQVERDEIKEVYRAIYRRKGGRPMEEVMSELGARTWSPAAARWIAFIRESLDQKPPRSRGVCGGGSRRRVPSSTDRAETAEIG